VAGQKTWVTLPENACLVNQYSEQDCRLVTDLVSRHQVVSCNRVVSDVSTTCKPRLCSKCAL
jgi:hypothetical protein